MNFKTGSGVLVNLSEGGMLMRSDFVLPVGTTGTLHFTPSNGPFEIEAEGEVVGVQGDLVAIRFLQKPETASWLMQWLEREHYPWTGSIATDAWTDGGTRPPHAVPLQNPSGDTEMEGASELVFQEA